MVKKFKKSSIGAWSFLIGVILATILGLFNTQVGQLGPGPYSTMIAILFILGLIIGILNVNDRESSRFLLAGIALVIVSYMGQSVLSIIDALGNVLDALLIIFVPATIIVALKSVFEIEKK